MWWKKDRLSGFGFRILLSHFILAQGPKGSGAAPAGAARGGGLEEVMPPRAGVSHCLGGQREGEVSWGRAQRGLLDSEGQLLTRRMKERDWHGKGTKGTETNERRIL